MLATLRTNQWYPVRSRYQTYFDAPLAAAVEDPEGDMKLPVYIAGFTSQE
jgi:hypothetical protein